MLSSTGLFWSSEDNEWASAPSTDTLLDPRMIRNLNSAASMSQTTWSDHLGKDSKICEQAHLASLTPDPHTSAFVLKIQLFPCRLSLVNLLFEWRISLWFPRAPTGLHSVLWSRAGSAYTWASSQPDGPPGGVAVDSWIFKSPVNIWEFFLILLHVAHWTGGTRWGAVVDDALWRSSVACSW